MSRDKSLIKNNLEIHYLPLLLLWELSLKEGYYIFAQCILVVYWLWCFISWNGYSSFDIFKRNILPAFLLYWNWNHFGRYRRYLECRFNVFFFNVMDVKTTLCAYLDHCLRFQYATILHCRNLITIKGLLRYDVRSILNHYTRNFFWRLSDVCNV